MGLSQHGDADTTAVYFTVDFEQDGLHYTGRLTPEYKKDLQQPSSWHVVLNEVFFGYLHKDGEHWEVTEQRPALLTQKLGQLIDSGALQIHTV